MLILSVELKRNEAYFKTKNLLASSSRFNMPNILAMFVFINYVLFFLK